jgi:hypothetical protein
MAPGRKTGGRIAGVSKNKPKPLKLPDTEANRALIAMAPTAEFRSPKAVMLSAMMKFERMSDVLMAKAERMTGEQQPYEDIKQVVAEAHKFTFAAVNCADRVAPYIHARLIAVQGEAAADKPAFVIRAPAVMSDSSAWQAAVGAAVVDMEAQSGSVVRQNEVAATQVAPEPKATPAPSPVVLANDPKTNRITVMPPGPRVVQPTGTAEWLARVETERRRAGGS